VNVCRFEPAVGEPAPICPVPETSTPEVAVQLTEKLPSRSRRLAGNRLGGAPAHRAIRGHAAELHCVMVAVRPVNVTLLLIPIG